MNVSTPERSRDEAHFVHWYCRTKEDKQESDISNEGTRTNTDRRALGYLGVLSEEIKDRGRPELRVGLETTGILQSIRVRVHDMHKDKVNHVTL